MAVEDDARQVARRARNAEKTRRYRLRQAERGVDLRAKENEMRRARYHADPVAARAARKARDAEKREAISAAAKARAPRYAGKYRAKRAIWVSRNAAAIAAQSKAWIAANPARHAEWKREWTRRRETERYTSEPGYRIEKCLRARLRAKLVAGRAGKVGRTVQLLGCTVADLVLHLEAQFQPGMSWENHGARGWHVDHRIPCAAFDLTDPEQQRRCFHYTNLQPLWAPDNLRKGARHSPQEF